MPEKENIENNRKTWNAVSDLFINGSSLPVWAPFGVGEDLNLIPEIKNKVFLEIGCGSGRSIKHLTDRGAKKVYGLDVSDEQVKESKKHNEEAIKKGVVEIIQAPMEEKLSIEPVDVVFSIYGIGWTQNPEKTLSNIFSYLKSGGRFIWSWDHSFFTDVAYEDGKYVVQYSYHDERPIEIKDWKKEGHTARITYRKIDTWFKLLIDAEFQVVGYHEPKPKNTDRAHKEPEKYYSIQKAEKVPATFIFVCEKPEMQA